MLGEPEALADIRQGTAAYAVTGQALRRGRIPARDGPIRSRSTSRS